MAQIMTKGRKGMAGCSFYNDCFTCPYPDCIMDTGINKVSLARKVKAIELRNLGKSVRQIAIALGLSERQVKRYFVK